MTHFHVQKKQPKAVKPAKDSHKAKREPWIVLVLYQNLATIQAYGPFESYTHGRTWALNNGVMATSMCFNLNDPEKGVVKPNNN